MEVGPIFQKKRRDSWAGKVIEHERSASNLQSLRAPEIHLFSSASLHPFPIGDTYAHRCGHRSPCGVSWVCWSCPHPIPFDLYTPNAKEGDWMTYILYAAKSSPFPPDHDATEWGTKNASHPNTCDKMHSHLMLKWSELPENWNPPECLIPN